VTATYNERRFDFDLELSFKTVPTREPVIFHGGCPRGRGEFIAYLDVWTGEVTAIEDVQLRQPALDGIDFSIVRQCPKQG